MPLSKELEHSIDEAVSHYFDDSIELLDGLTYSQYQTIKKVEYYTNSRYLAGQRDRQGRIKPFYNINNFRVQIAVRATDLDIKNINIEADEPEDSLKALLLNQELYNWMKKTNFSKTLNDLGGTRPRYGGVLAKRVEKDGEVMVEVPEWKNMITDQSDVMGGIMIERHFLSPADLQKKEDVWDNTDEAIKLARKPKDTSGQTSNSSGNTDEVSAQSNIPQVEVQEIYMDVPDKFNPTTKKKGNTFRPMQIILATDGAAKVVMHMQEKERPYKYLPWEVISGRGLGRGQVEDGFEAQMWTNDAIIAQKNAMDLSSKVIITTSSTELDGNALTDLDNGTIINLQEKGFFKSTQLLPSALPELSNMVDQWDKQYSEVSSSFNSISGEEPPSGTPFRSLALQARQGASYFDYKREEFGIFIKEIVNEWILPELTKKLSKQHTLVTQLPGDKLELIDNLFVASRLEKGVKDFVRKNKLPPTREQVEREQQRLVEFLSQTGNTRYLEVPKAFYKDIKAEVTIITTGEQKDKEADNDRLLGLLEVASKTGNQQLMTELIKKIIDSQDVGLSSQQFGPQEAPGSSANINTGGEPAVAQELEAALPQAQI